MTPDHIGMRILLAFAAWFAVATYLGVKLGKFMRHEDRLFGFMVPRMIRRG